MWVVKHRCLGTLSIALWVSCIVSASAADDIESDLHCTEKDFARMGGPVSSTVRPCFIESRDLFSLWIVHRARVCGLAALWKPESPISLDFRGDSPPWWDGVIGGLHEHYGSPGNLSPDRDGWLLHWESEVWSLMVVGAPLPPERGGVRHAMAAWHKPSCSPSELMEAQPEIVKYFAELTHLPPPDEPHITAPPHDPQP